MSFFDACRKMGLNVPVGAIRPTSSPYFFNEPEVATQAVNDRDGLVKPISVPSGNRVTVSSGATRPISARRSSSVGERMIRGRI
jgi:hypothetical protein